MIPQNEFEDFLRITNSSLRDKTEGASEKEIEKRKAGRYKFYSLLYAKTPAEEKRFTHRLNNNNHTDVHQGEAGYIFFVYNVKESDHAKKHGSRVFVIYAEDYKVAKRVGLAVKKEISWQEYPEKV